MIITVDTFLIMVAFYSLARIFGFILKADRTGTATTLDFIDAAISIIFFYISVWHLNN